MSHFSGRVGYLWSTSQSWALCPGPSLLPLWSGGSVFLDSLTVEMSSCWQNHSLLSKACWLDVSLTPTHSCPSPVFFRHHHHHHQCHVFPPWLGIMTACPVGTLSYSFFKTMFKSVIQGTKGSSSTSNSNTNITRATTVCGILFLDLGGGDANGQFIIVL